MPADTLMAAMNRGMEGATLMPSSTPPTLAMRGYDLGSMKSMLGPVEGIAFDRVRNPLQALNDVFKLLQP